MNLKKFTFKLNSSFHRVINTCISRFIMAISNLRNGRKEKIFVYADSRGFCYDSPKDYGDIRKTYIWKLAKEYYIDYEVAKEKYTTLIDFLVEIKKRNKKYKHVILHCGIVDFCFRGESSYQELIKSKIKMHDFLNIPNEEVMSTEISDVEYEGERTRAYINEKLLVDYLIPKIQELKSIIYIGINPVCLDWQGTYWRARPTNINDQLRCDEVMRSNFKNHIDLSDKSESWIKQNTSDNVHLNSAGHQEIFKLLQNRLARSYR